MWAWIQSVARHRMRGYYLGIAGGAMLVTSAFLPWVFVGELSVGAVPEIPALWVLGLGILAVVLASLSVITRKNSRHPLLVVGLAAFGVLFLSYQWLMRTVTEQAWAKSQALAIVDDVRAPTEPEAVTGPGVYLGLAGSIVLVLFGLTIIVRRVSQPYATPEDD